jgi:deoxyribodipyrimidine photo-lyase
MVFPITSHEDLISYCKNIDGIKYGKTRNYINGAVTRLSAYITHGIITTQEVVNILLTKYTIDEAEILFKELLRREYFVQVHYWKGDSIFQDMEEDKTTIPKEKILPDRVVEKTTSSKRVNQAIVELEQT